MEQWTTCAEKHGHCFAGEVNSGTSASLQVTKATHAINTVSPMVN